jgi:transcriptional regulator GlxA family with amidase domain
VAKNTIVDGISPLAVRRRHLVAVVVFDGVVLTDFAIPCDVFRLAQRADGQPAYDVRVCGVRSRAASAASAPVNLTAGAPLTLLRKAETIVIPGISDPECPVSDALVKELRRAIHRGARVATICSGTFILALTGALDGQVAATHWNVASELARRFPAITVDPDVLYVDGGQLLTSAGVAAGFDLCLHMVRHDCGAEVASRVARMVVMPLERAGGQAQFIVHEQPDVPDATFGPLMSWIERNLRSDLSLPVIARRAAMSGRTLSRRFRTHVGMTPAAWIGKARVREAQRLLETTTLSMEIVAEAVGYRSATVFRERFAAIVGVSPLAYRRAFSSEVAHPEPEERESVRSRVVGRSHEYSARHS